MDLTDRDLALILSGLFELRITHLEDDALWVEIAAVAEKLAGDVGAMFFGTAFDELEAVNPCLVDHFVVRHCAMVARQVRCPHRGARSWSPATGE